jgi:vitamin B12 transporter
MKKLILIAVWLFLILPAFAQDSIPRMALPVAQVTSAIDLDMPKNAADSIQRAWTKSGSIGDLLLRNGQTVVRPYGAPGSAVTAASQGLLGDHFSVLWNGFELNSPSLGLSDFSQLPVSFFEEIDQHQHASSSAFSYGSGAGGMMELNNAFQSEQEFMFAHNSLNNQSYSLQSGFEWDKLKLQTQAFKRKASNEFEYTDFLKFGHPVLSQAHNNHDLLGVMQSVFGGNRWKWEGHMWWQESNTSIPETLGSFGQSYAQQSDASLRLSTAIQRSFNKINLRFSGAHFYTKQHYIDRNSPFGEYTIDSRIQTLQQSLRGELNWYLKQTKFFAKSNFERQEASTNTYHNERVLAFNQSVGVHHQRKTWDLLALVRADLNSQALPFVLGDLSLNFRPLKTINARINASRIYRLPDLNERFWGGEEERFLNAEEGWKGSTQVLLQPVKKKAWKESYASVSLTRILMDQMIQWLPNSAGVFRPINSGDADIQQVQAEIFLERKGKIGFNIMAKVLVQEYLNAPFWLNDHQLEQNNVRASLDGNLEYKSFHLNAAWRYRQNDYFPGIPANWRFNELHLFDLGLGKLISGKRSNMMLLLQCQNLLNTPQQFLPATAMPGRVVEIQCQFTFKPKAK